ncbi:MAG: hypothetical protein V1818_01720 [Candidatus Aenigmatarchaeota archaeon]
MSTKCDSIFEEIYRICRFVPASTFPGINRLESQMKRQLKRYPIEDECSVIRDVDFSVNRVLLKEQSSFLIDYTCVDAMPKINLSGVDVEIVNQSLENIFLDKDLELFFGKAIRGSVKNVRRKGKRKIETREYFIPIGEIDSDEECPYIGHIIYEATNGHYQYPSFKQYKAPVLRLTLHERRRGEVIMKDMFRYLIDLKENEDMLKKI